MIARFILTVLGAVVVGWCAVSGVVVLVLLLRVAGW